MKRADVLTPTQPSKAQWTLTQERLLAVLRQPEHSRKSQRKICRLAGFKSDKAWRNAMRDEQFAALVATLRPPKAQWTPTQERLLAVLRQPEHSRKSQRKICRLAGFKSDKAWRNAMRDEQFAALVATLPKGQWTPTQERLLAVLRQPEHSHKSRHEICRLAGYKSDKAWWDARRDEQFAALVATLRPPKAQWTPTQERLLAVLRQPEHSGKSQREICHLAGFKSNGSWRDAMRDEQFAALVATLRPPKAQWTPTQERLLAVLRQPEHSRKSQHEICRLAGFESRQPWAHAMRDQQFAALIATLRPPEQVAYERARKAVSRSKYTPHVEVQLVVNPEQVLTQDLWDIRQLRADYPKHTPPSYFVVDFSWIVNKTLRDQVKRYFRNHLSQWKPSTFNRKMYALKPLLERLTPDMHLGSISRQWIEEILPSLYQRGDTFASRCLVTARQLFDYMATSPTWTEPRLPRFLIWPEDMPRLAENEPRPIPPDVVEKLDTLLDTAVCAMERGAVPPILPSKDWDAILILRRTGMRLEDLAHLKEPDEQNRDGCLEQESDGSWWVRIHHKITKTGKSHRIPTCVSDGVLDAVARQRERVRLIPDHFGEHYLFRTYNGVLNGGTFEQKLVTLAPHLLHDGQPYRIRPHQFRHTIATDMIENGVDVFTVKEFLGHSSLAMTEKYVEIYLNSLKAKYVAYRAKTGLKRTQASFILADQIRVHNDAGAQDGGWVEGRVGQLYRSPLPNGIGNCMHLPMNDPCPTPPHCPTCPKLQATRRHEPSWENKVLHLRLTVESLDDPAYDRARQMHEQELRHAEKVLDTIKREGLWDGRIHNS